MTDWFRGSPIERKWLKLGVAIAALNYAFLFAVLLLLEFDPALALTVGVILGIGSGVALTTFVLYIR